MTELTQVTIDFERSHLVFPTLVGGLLLILGLAILIRDRRAVAASGAHWRRVYQRMDRARFFGTLLLTGLYFSLMVPVGNLWPNTGRGFLFCSIPFVFLIGLLFLHELRTKEVLVLAGIALCVPTLVWWLFFDIFFLTLP